jgi:hypothetical protein
MEKRVFGDLAAKRLKISRKYFSYECDGLAKLGVEGLDSGGGFVREVFLGCGGPFRALLGRSWPGAGRSCGSPASRPLVFWRFLLPEFQVW